MAFHHVAITTKDLDATHRFYTEAMGFELVKVEAAPTTEPGWARHLFYDTGNGEMLAVWDIHDDDASPEYRTEISTGLGLPPWANHIAFDVARPRRPRSSRSSAGSTTASTACASTTAGARRSTPTTRTASRWSSARRPASSPTTTARRPHALLAASKPALNGTEPEVEFFTAAATT